MLGLLWSEPVAITSARRFVFVMSLRHAWLAKQSERNLRLFVTHGLAHSKVLPEQLPRDG